MASEDTKPPEKLLKDVESYDKKDLKHIQEKGDMTPSQARDLTMAAITGRRPDSLKHVETVEKNTLPGKEEIEAEKKMKDEGK